MSRIETSSQPDAVFVLHAFEKHLDDFCEVLPEYLKVARQSRRQTSQSRREVKF